MDQVPVFVRVEETKVLNDQIENLKQLVAKAQSTLHNITTISDSEKSKIIEWQTKYNNVNDKMDTITKVLVEPETI